MNLADELDASRSIDRDLDARIAVALYKDAENSDSMDNTYARLPSKHDGCTPGTYWISAFSGLSLRTAPGFTGDRLLKQIAIGALRHFHPHNEALHATEPAQDCEAAWKKLREYCTNGLPFYDNEDGWRAIANAVLRATEPAQVGDADFTEAWTGPTPEKGYVGFINITRIGGNVRVRLRPESHPDCGQVSELDIPVANARDLFSAIGRQLGIAQGRAEAQAPLLARIAAANLVIEGFRFVSDADVFRLLDDIHGALRSTQ